MKKIFILFILICLLTGCTSYTELNDLSIVSMMAINYADDKYELILQIVDGKIDDSEVEKQTTIVSSKEKSLEECFHSIYQTTPKKLYLSHIDLLVLTNEAINHDFKNIISHFIKNNEYRNNFNIIVFNDNLREFMLDNKTEDINNLLKTNKQESGITTDKDFETILNELLIDTNTYLPTISYKNNKILLEGYTLITNYKIKKQLSIKDSILLNLLDNKIHKSYLNNTNILDNQTLTLINKNNVTFQFITTLENKDDFIKQTKTDLELFLSEYENNYIDILKLREKIRKNNYFYYQKEKNNLFSKIIYNFEFKIKIKETELRGDDFIETR